MIGVTADINIYVSAPQFGGLPRQFLFAVRTARFYIAISAPIQVELQRVLRDKFCWTAEMLARERFSLSQMTRLVQPTQVIDAVPGDAEIIGCWNARWSPAHASL